MKKILIPVTNQGTLAGEKNGTYAPELTHALHAFIEGGYDYDLVSVKGGEAPIYGEDTEGDTINSELLADATLKDRLAHTKTIDQINPDDYDAVFYPGGFGLLFDLHEDEGVAAVTGRLYERGAVVGAVCHGPAGLLPVTLSDGSSILAGKAVTGFTREEEISYGTIDKIPFLLEEALVKKAGQYRKVAEWDEHVIAEDRLITGQNPASAHAVGKAMVARLRAG